MTASHTKTIGQVTRTVESPQILIADDDPTTRMMLRAAVTQWGYEVAEASDGEAAWEMLQRSNAPKLLILDWLMPKVDGVQLCSRIRNDLKFQHYIILLTQLSGAANLIRGLEAGADEFLSKPFNMAELCSRLAVGTRVLGFESKTSARNRQFEANLSQLIKLSTDMLIHTNDAYKLASEISNENERNSLVQKIKELQDELGQGSKIIKKIEDILKI